MKVMFEEYVFATFDDEGKLDMLDGVNLKEVLLAYTSKGAYLDGKRIRMSEARQILERNNVEGVGVFGGFVLRVS